MKFFNSTKGFGFIEQGGGRAVEIGPACQRGDEHGPDWNFLIRCTVALNRSDDGEEQNSAEKALRQERPC
ncbi:hypothetical protein [Aquamicrobium terrae]